MLQPYYSKSKHNKFAVASMEGKVSHQKLFERNCYSRYQQQLINKAMTYFIYNQTKNRIVHHSSGVENNFCVDIQLEEIALVKAQLFAMCNVTREVGGLLIGPQPIKQTNGRYLTSVTDVIYAFHTKSSLGEITFTADSWAQMTDERISRFPNMATVGWFHSHPDFGVFYSNWDISLHAGFFSFSFMLGLVLDPVRKQLDFFAWNMNKEICKVGIQLPAWAHESWFPIGEG